MRDETWESWRLSFCCCIAQRVLHKAHRSNPRRAGRSTQETRGMDRWHEARQSPADYCNVYTGRCTPATCENCSKKLPQRSHRSGTARPRGIHSSAKVRKTPPSAAEPARAVLRHWIAKPPKSSIAPAMQAKISRCETFPGGLICSQC